MNKRKYFILDFDSTFIKVEALDELAKISLKNDKEKVSKLKKIHNLTKRAMDGKMSFPKSLGERLKLIGATKDDLNKLAIVLKKQISNSILRNKDFFKKFAAIKQKTTIGFS